MIDIAKFKGLQPAHAEGRVRIDLTDPFTGKVKHRQEGKNHVFPESLLCGTGGNWVESLSAAYLALSDSADDIDLNFPYMVGTTIGYGIPSQGSSGTYRGAYSVANQVLAAVNGLTSLRWKFQFDFTPAQANGTIRRVGLTGQYSYLKESQPAQRFPVSTTAGTSTYMSDGRYCYYCSTAGVVTKYDMYLSATTTIDVSLIVGTVGTTTKNVGYAPATGKYYIYAQSSTAANRKMYVFSDNTFSNLEATYSISNISMAGGPLYIYGNFAFSCGGTSAIYGADFVNNVAQTMYTAPATPFNATAGNNVVNAFTVGYGKYILSATDTSLRIGAIFDMAAKAFSGSLNTATSISGGAGGYGHMTAPIADTFMVGQTKNGVLYVNPAIAMKKLDTPVTKTSANGMTVTYELEVFW